MGRRLFGVVRLLVSEMHYVYILLCAPRRDTGEPGPRGQKGLHIHTQTLGVS